jgi:prepilin-type N-terminal cleavage/methylation domain-containing protein
VRKLAFAFEPGRSLTGRVEPRFDAESGSKLPHFKMCCRARMHPRALAGRGLRGFVLLEILVSVVILGIALAAMLQCFTNGLKAVRRDRVITDAVFLAQSVLDDFEIRPPEEDAETIEGDFGPEFANFRFVARFESVEIDYRDRKLDTGQMGMEFEPMRKVDLRVYHEPPDGRKPVQLLHVQSYLTGIEKYAPSTKFANALY